MKMDSDDLKIMVLGGLGIGVLFCLYDFFLKPALSGEKIEDNEDEDNEVILPEAEYDEEGYDKRGFDREGYNKDGYNAKGYDREGYDKDGYNVSGCDREGYDRRGLKDGYNRDGYNVYGYKQNGYDKNGYDKCGKTQNHYQHNIADLRSNYTEVYNDMKKGKYLSVMRQFRCIMEDAVKLVTLHNTGKSGKLSDNLKICQSHHYINLNDDMFHQLHQIRKRCNQASHSILEESGNNDFDYMFYCYKTIGKLIDQVEIDLDCALC